jgi:2-polyprenyl-6-methoxyphenol hydroxylase-like FAD-dependent oxidoreductase
VRRALKPDPHLAVYPAQISAEDAMSNTTVSPPRHALVIGAGIAGLLAARALSGHFDRVTVVERDALPGAAGHRKGVPQAEHAHGLLAGGCEALEELFPGLTRNLITKGALDGDILADSLWIAHGVALARKPSRLEGLLMSRGLLEAQIRDRVRALPNVALVAGSSVRALAFDGIARRVTGVLVDGRDDLADGVDLVVDASGRGSRAPAWLEAIGFDAPAQDEIDVGLSYSTRAYRRSRGDLGGKLVALCGASAPDWRFGVALAQEGERVIVTLGGYFGDAAPLDDDGFRAFADSLPTPAIASVIRPEVAISQPRSVRFPSSRRRRYERLTRFPGGFLVFGDALCSFNPVYGQGMTVAALQARALDAALTRGTDALAKRFFAAAARVIDAPWRIAVGADFDHPRLAPRATRLQRAFNWYVARLHRAAARDAQLSETFLAVANLTAPPSALLRPSVLARVVAGNLVRPRPAKAATALLLAE